MKQSILISILALTAFAVFGATSAFAATAAGPTDVAVLYNGNTPVNTDALHFMSKQFSALGSPYRLKPIRDAQKIKAGDYKAVLLLNTSLSTGIDRMLADFIKGWDNKNQIILISLRKGSKDFTVTQAPASPSTLGVDAITAASEWTGRGLGSLIGGKGSSAYEMHVDWVNRVIALIDKIH
jgi:hypothetical protein